MIRMDSPTWAIVSIRFFLKVFLFINNTSKFRFCMVWPATSRQSSGHVHIVCGKLQVAADDSVHFTDLAHGALQVLHHVHFVTSIVGCAVVVLLTYRPRVGRTSNAVFENQIVAVLLHRIDEELLHRNLLHSNTSWNISAVLGRVVSFLSLESGRAVICSPQDGRIIAPVSQGKKCQNWLPFGKYWLPWIDYERKIVVNTLILTINEQLFTVYSFLPGFSYIHSCTYSYTSVATYCDPAFPSQRTGKQCQIPHSPGHFFHIFRH